MDLVLNPSFKPAGKPLKLGELSLMETDFSSAWPDLGAWSNHSSDEAEKKKVDEIAETISSVQPIKPNAFADALKALDEAVVQGKPSLMKIYADGMWPTFHDTHGVSPITSISDMELVFEDMVKATRHYVETTLGLSVETTLGLSVDSMDVWAGTSIVAIHLEKQIVRAINECVIPALAIQTTMHPFDTNLLAAAVKLRACHKPGWKLPWEKFVNKLHGIVVKCDESKPMKKFVEKLVKANPELLTNTEGFDGAIVDPSPEASAKLKKLFGWAMEQGKDNQPVPCDPPKPHKPLAVTKVPVTDEHGNKVAAPVPKWWLGDDLCWHPPLIKEQEACAFDLVTALNHPSVVLDSMGVSIGGHGTVGPGGEVEDLKIDGAWPVSWPKVTLAKSAPYPPLVADDVVKGFKVGDVWHNSSDGVLYRCMDCTVSAAVWHVIGEVTPTPEGPKIILPGKPQHLVDLENQMIEGMKLKLGKLKLGDPVTATYTNTSDQPDLVEKDLIQKMTEQIKKDMEVVLLQQMSEKLGVAHAPDASKAPLVGFQMPGAPPNTVVMQPVMSLDQVDKNGDVFEKPVLPAGMSDVAYMQEAFSKATKIPKHLLHGEVHNSR